MNAYYENLKPDQETYDSDLDFIMGYICKLERMIKYVKENHVNQPYTEQQARHIHLIEHHMSMVDEHMDSMEFDMVDNNICEPSLFPSNQRILDVYDENPNMLEDVL